MTRIDFVSNGEIVFDVNFSVFADVADGSENMEITTEIFLNRFSFSGRLDDN